MPYTVAYADGGIERHEFDTYLRLLGKRSIDWTEAQRVAEPDTQDQWVYVWQNEGDARSFCDEIRRETSDDKWYVRELDDLTRISQGPLMPVIIHMTRQSLGCTFSLHPHSRSAIRRRFPQAHQASSLSIEYGTRTDFEQTCGPIWDHVAITLSGLSLEQLAELGGYRVFDLEAESVVHDSALNKVA
jgi:hypothetical protein